ncbi:MAG: iron-only hydrogenase system regulator [Fusobacteria bacterium]|nr:iron-only hydrogenase system regulator [Fusobacteriota bacterium]
MDKRIGTLSLFLNSQNVISQVNTLLSEYSEIVCARLGMPYREKNISVIMLVIDGTTDEIGALTGKLGNIDGIQVKAALAK